MSPSSILFTTLGVNAAVAGLCAWGVAALQKRLLRRRIPDTYQKLRPENWILLMAMAAFWIAMLFTATFAYAKTNVRPLASGDALKTLIFALLFYMLSAKILLSYFALLGLSPSGVACWAIGRGRKSALEVPWGDIKAVRYGALSGRISFATKSGVFFSAYTYGEQTLCLLDAFDKHLYRSAIDDKSRKALDALRARILKWSRPKA